jgi:hypothetical protein
MMMPSLEKTSRKTRCLVVGGIPLFLIVAQLLFGSVTARGEPNDLDSPTRPAVESRKRLSEKLGNSFETATDFWSAIGDIGTTASDVAVWPRTKETSEFLHDSKGLSQIGYSINGITTIAKTSERVRKAIQKGDVKDLYLLFKETSIEKASELIGAAAGLVVRPMAIVASGGNPIVVGLASYAANYFVTKAVEGVLTSLWDRLEELLRELFGEFDGLNGILDTAKADLRNALDRKLNELQPSVAKANSEGMAAQVGRALDNAPSATAQTVVSSGLELAYIFDNSGKQIAVPYSSATTGTPDKLYDIQLLGSDRSQQPDYEGKGYRIMTGVPTAEARNFILYNKQFNLPSDRGYSFIGVLREYPYDPNIKSENKYYPSLPTIPRLREMP